MTAPTAAAPAASPAPAATPADAALAAEFRDKGFVTLPRLLPPALVEELVGHLERLSGRARGAGGAGGWTAPDGVTRHPEFWPVIFHPGLLAAVRLLLGPDARYLQHTDLHVGFSSFNWHRDSVSRTLGVGPDWDEADAPYRIARVGIYLQAATGAFKFGLVPGTHRPDDARAARARRAAERGAGWLGHARRLVTGRNPDLPGAEWVSAGAGDAVVFDPRVLHTGTPVDGAKYSLFIAYGVPNRHAAHHAHYYRHVRTELGYGAIPDALADQLRAAGLYFEPSRVDALAGATLPSAFERLAMERRRAR